MDNSISTHKYTNDLINESSPYLLQHAHNPVNWVAWSEKALKQAKDENKMLIISIGYAACHWCHVMEHESFEDSSVAKLMNEHFVCIKVDREERPDVDQVYMTAAQLITGSGGWPLNALALPDGKPFYAGTYFPKQNWMKMLSHFVELKNRDPEAIKDQAQKVTEGIKASENISFSTEKSMVSMEQLTTQFNSWKSTIDFEKGGENRAPKFPMPSNWEYLLQYHHLSENEDALKAVTVTLDNMAMGGIYDQLGGGFSRYSTDEDWLVPHFEKMLYDNAQLVSLYSHAYQLTKKHLYKQRVFETLDFVERELLSPDFGFYSSLDADSEGEEGRFYVWTSTEIQKVLGENAALFMEYFQVIESGNWEEGKNILHRKQTDESFAENHNINIESLRQQIEKSKEQLLKLRSKRVRPGTDDKILCSWNALMLKGYVDAYRAFGEERFLQMALKNADFLMNNLLQENKELLRNFKNGKASIPGLLDDYAFTVSAFIALYQVTFDEKWIYAAKEINETALQHFFDPSSGMFFYTHEQYADLVVRKMEVSDNVIPSSNSEMAKNLFALARYFEKDDYSSKAKQMFLNVQTSVQQNIRYYSNWAMLEISLLQAPFEVAIVGENCGQLKKELDQHYIPNALFLGGEREGSLSLLEGKLIKNQTMIFVCKNKQCKLPTSDTKEALKQMKIE